MGAIKIMTVAVAALFLLMVFQNSYSQSNAIAEAKEVSVLQPTTEASSPAEPKDIVSDSGPIQSVPGPPIMSGSVTQPRAQYAITEAILMVVAFVILGLIAIPVVCISPILLLIFLCISPFFIGINIVFIFLIMVLPVLLASFADVSSYEIPGAIQAILKDIGSKGTLTEIAFAYFKNLWRIVVHLPEIARLTGNLDTEDYAVLIKRFGSFVLDYPRNLRALPNKILHNLFPTVNALPAWLRQAPVLLQVFPMLMYALMILPLVALIGFGFIFVLGLAVTIALSPILLIISAPLLIIGAAIVLGLFGLVFGVTIGLAAGIVLGAIVFIAILLIVTIICALAGIALGAIVLGGIGFIIGAIVFLIGVAIALVGFFAGWFSATIGWWIGIGAFVIGILIFLVALFGGLIIGGILGLIIGGGLGLFFGFVLGFGAFIAIVLCFMAVGFVIGACLGVLAAVAGLVCAALLLCVLIPLSIVVACIALPIVLCLIPILGGALVLLTLPLMLPVGPQAVKSYPAVFGMFLSLAENSISIPLGLCVGLPMSACLSVFRGLPGSLRAVANHAIDFCVTPFIVSMRALPLMGTFVVLAILWIAGMGLFTVFSPFICIAPVFIVLALFAQGLIDREKDKNVKVLDTNEIKKSIDNLPKNVGEVDRVVKRITEMLGKAATTDVSGLLDAFTGVNWLIATQNLPRVLPAAMQAVGSAIPACVDSAPDIVQALIESGLNLIIAFSGSFFTVITTMIKDIFAVMWAMPKFAILIPQMLEIFSVITINLPALIQGFIPAAVDAVEQTTVSLPELCPSIVLSTMGLNAIVLQFAKAVWDMSANIFKMITDFLWSIILYLPKTVFDFDECVTPWFGPRLLSVCGLCIGSIPAGCCGICSAVCSMLISGCLELCMMCYMPLMAILQVVNFIVETCTFCGGFVNACVTCFTYISGCIVFIGDISVLCGEMCTALSGIDVFGVIFSIFGAVFAVIGEIIALFAQGLIDQCIIETCTTIAGFITDILTFFKGIVTNIQMFTNYFLPVFFFILVILALFPLILIVVAFMVLAVIYFLFYIFQILAGTLLMACSGIFDSIVCVPLMSLCEPVPVVSTLLGYMRTFTSFYAFCIPPNVIEIITQSIPCAVNCLAACPAIAFMPISLLRTFMSTGSRAVEALPSVPAYIGRLTDRIIFSCCAEISGMISLFIDVMVALMLMAFSCSTSLCDQCLSLDILTKAPQIAILVLALIFVIFAWVIDLCGIMCLRAPDMINEYANSILKSMAMMPILSAIVPGMAGAPAQMQPEVVSSGLSKLVIILVLFLCCCSPILGALATLIYNLFKEVFMWLYGTAPSLFCLPCNLCRRGMDSVNRICSGIGSAIGGAANSIESQLIPYEG